MDIEINPENLEHVFATPDKSEVQIFFNALADSYGLFGPLIVTVRELPYFMTPEEPHSREMTRERLGRVSGKLLDSAARYKKDSGAPKKVEMAGKITQFLIEHGQPTIEA